MDRPPTRDELEAAHCWEAADAVPGDPEMTAFRRRVRYEQALWREANGHPIGTQPIVPRVGKPSRLVGSRLPLEYARTTGANFVTPAAHAAAMARLAMKEPHQSLDRQRLLADLLWSTPLACNLFGDLAVDLEQADRAVHTWWPDAPGTVAAVRFVHSPGWLDLAFTGSLVAFDAAFVLDCGDGTQGIVGLTTKFHDRAERHEAKPERLARKREVAETSGAFVRDVTDAVDRTELLVTWFSHLLVLSMLQHPSGRWTWGRYVVVHAAGNLDYTGICERYRLLLTDQSTFASMTIDEIVDSGALAKSTAAALRTRYLGGSAPS